MKMLFANISQSNLAQNVCIGEKFSSRYSYALGYYEAANIILEKTLSLNPPYKDRLFYPLCFNYRQFTELTLKQLIIFADKLYDKSIYLGYERKKLNSSRTNQLTNTHSLEKLLHNLIDILTCISDEEFDKTIKSLIIEFHNFDPTGQKFRYPVLTNDTYSFPQQTFFDLKNISTHMKNILNYLMGVDGWIDYYNSLADSIIDNYSGYY